MNAFLQHLQQPEYLHVLLNPVPVYGLLFGVIALIVALFFRSRAALIPALAAIALSGALAWPVFEFGEKSYDRVFTMVNSEGDAWLNTHMHRAEKLIYAFYALAVLAVLAIILPQKFPKTMMPLALATLALGLATLAAGMWIAYPAGKVRHTEFRTLDEPPPESAAREAEHD